MERSIKKEQITLNSKEFFNIKKFCYFIAKIKKLKIFLIYDELFFLMDPSININKYIKFLEKSQYLRIYEYDKIYDIPRNVGITELKATKFYSTVPLLEDPFIEERVLDFNSFVKKNLFISQGMIISDDGSVYPNENKLYKLKTAVNNGPRTMYVCQYNNLYDILLFLKNLKNIPVFRYLNAVVFYIGSSILMDICYDKN